MKLTTRFLTRATRLAAKSQEMQNNLTEAFRERYGVTYSDVDCDFLIEALDYNGGDLLTLEECDLHMKECGYLPT
jgi:hypothetical protein